MKFDCIVSNAPYNNGLHEKFEAKYFDICDGQIVWVSPLSFLLGKKQNKRITLELDKYKTVIERINGNEYFDAVINGAIGIVFCDMNNINNGADIKFDGKNYSKCDEISLTSNDELLNEFKRIITPLYTHDNLDNNFKVTNKRVPSGGDNRFFEPNPNYNWYCFHVSPFASNKGFYSLFPNNEVLNNKKQGIYKELFAKDINHEARSFYYAFNNKQECNNFINYGKTFFARGCLIFSKLELSLHGGALKTVPWFDFSDPVFSKSPSEIDDYLFAKYIPEVDEKTGITRDDIRKHIEELLPDYYSIRNKIK